MVTTTMIFILIPIGIIAIFISFTRLGENETVKNIVRCVALFSELAAVVLLFYNPAPIAIDSRNLVSPALDHIQTGAIASPNVPVITATPAPQPLPKRSLSKGDELIAVNCSLYVTLRKTTDGSQGKKVAEILPGDTVTYISPAENGFYKVEYNGQQGYALAVYLAPADSSVFLNSLSSPASDAYFSKFDLEVNGITIGVTNKRDVESLFGNPINIIDSVKDITLNYSDFSCTFSKSTLKAIRVDIFGSKVYGPHRIFIGMHIAEALNEIKFNKSSIWKNSITHDLLLYSGKQGEPYQSYAVVRNKGLAGNGKIAFYENENNGHMDIELKDSYVTKISVYIE